MPKIELLLDALGTMGPERLPTVVLRESDGSRFLLLHPGRGEWPALIQATEQLTPLRPSTHDLLVRWIELAGVKLESVCLRPWRGDVFAATLKGVCRDQPVLQDARPSDALILALRSGIPIYATAALMQQHGRHEASADIDVTDLQDLGPDAFGAYVN